MHFKSDKGNALFLILIAVALFAALSYAVTHSARGGGKDASDEQANLYASTITQYATAIESAIESAIMRIMVSNSCKDTEISFEHDANGDGNWFDTADEYHNPNSPPDLRCHVFHPNGGGASWQVPNDKWLAVDDSSKAGYGAYLFSGAICVASVGTGIGTLCWNNGTLDDTELIILIPYLTEKLCESV